MVSITADRRSEGSRLPNVHTFSLTSLFNLLLMQLAALCRVLFSPVLGVVVEQITRQQLSLITACACSFVGESKESTPLPPCCVCPKKLLV